MVTQSSWEQLTESLAARLPWLGDGDSIILQSGPFYTQLGQGPASIRIEAAAGDSLPADAQLTAAQEQQLGDLGWQPPAHGDQNWARTEPWPLSGRTATQLATMIVGALRDVFGLDAARVEERAFNAFSR
ncbi:hypothetical protein [Actinoplanes sp. NBRC 103695]|uniref:TY-Chap domain-containing protein n=1 Tax=Actinoplanes sp. NBRC 103695 TaxID=3032202 RepID=UPI00255565E3|nr:hypothetical protein [Actinoplanes sp. NBRC 103695]